MKVRPDPKAYPGKTFRDLVGEVTKIDWNPNGKLFVWAMWTHTETGELFDDRPASCELEHVIEIPDGD